MPICFMITTGSIYKMSDTLREQLMELAKTRRKMSRCVNLNDTSAITRHMEAMISVLYCIYNRFADRGYYTVDYRT